MSTGKGTVQFLFPNKRKKFKNEYFFDSRINNAKVKDVKEILEGTTTKPSWAMLLNQTHKNDLQIFSYVRYYYKIISIMIIYKMF